MQIFPPPHSAKLVTSDGYMSQEWLTFFNNLHQSLGQTVNEDGHVIPSQPTPNTRENLNVSGSSQSLGSVNYLTFSFNGNKGTLPALTNAGKTVNYDWKSSESVNTNLQGMCDALNTPYHWGITFNSTPAAGTYFEYNTSTAGQEFYVWFKVDGAGTDPAPAGRTGIQVDIGTGASVDAVATAVATALDAKSFSLPGAADLPAIPAAAQPYLEYKITL